MTTPYCLGFAFRLNCRTGQDEVVLIRKIKPDWQKGRLNGVGGKIEAGEYHNAAMAREFEEETGCHTLSLDWSKFTEMNFDDTVVYCFCTRLATHRDVATTTEEQVLVRDARRLPDDVLPNLDWLVPMAHHALQNPGSAEIPTHLSHKRHGN